MMRPGLVYWKMGTGVILTSIVGLPKLVEMAEDRDREGAANSVVCRQERPYGAVAWALSDQGPWKEIPCASG